MAHTIGHSHFFIPSRLTRYPPRIPPSSRPISPTVPLASPYSCGDSPRPPWELGRRMNVFVMVLSKASGNLYSSRKSITQSVSEALNLLKNVVNIVFISLATSVMLRCV